MDGQPAWKAALAARDDLQRYGSNRLLLFALSLRMGIEDVDTVAAEALIDGSDDKGCDLVLVDDDRRLAIIAQAYEGTSDRKEAPAIKASGLNGSVSWLLARDLSELSVRIRRSACELRAAIESGDIDTIEIWYVHNRPESENVRRELATVAETARHILRSQYGSPSIDIQFSEIGIATLENWYKSASTPILVTDSFEIVVPGGFRLCAGRWESFVTAVPASWLYDLHREHGTNLFSVNLRDYLGSRKSSANINNGIKESAEHDPDNFWVYNNGITALVNNFHTGGPAGCCLTIEGISIVNGAQTTGAVGSLLSPPSSSALVPIRLVKCTDRELVHDIIRYNNSQNQMVPADFRSTDKVQERLRREFKEQFAGMTYLGGRRGGSEDVIRRRTNVLTSDTVAQALAAFHQEPVQAYHRKRQLWETDALYSKLFGDATHADHIVFVYSLHRAIIDLKLALTTGESIGQQLTSTDEEARDFLRGRGGIYVLMSAIAASMEAFLGKPIPDSFALRFKRCPGLTEASEQWEPILYAAVPFCAHLTQPLERRLVNTQDVLEAAAQFRRFMQSTARGNKAVYDAFASAVASER